MRLNGFFKLLTVLFIINITACSVDSITDRVSVSYSSDKLIDAATKPYSHFSVTPSMLNNYLILFSRDKKPEIIEPIIENGDTLAYYVEYANNSGWSLIAADTRTTPLLAGAPSGSLASVNKNTKDFVLGLASSVKDISSSKDDEKEVLIWSFLKKTRSILTKNSLRENSKRGIAEGMWIPVDTVFAFDTVASNRIISTKWGQEEPWCYYTPYDPYSPESLNIHCYVGCSPVAAGQILYRYLHLTSGLYNIPDSVYFSNKQPHFFSFTSDWSNMAELSSNPNQQAKNKTAKFLSWVGNQMGTQYSRYGPSSTNDSSVINFLHNYLSFDVDTLSYNTVMSNLSLNIPVLVAATSSTNYRHAFIIDSYVTISYQVVITYEFDPYYSVSEEDYLNYPSWMFEWPSPAQYPSYDPEKEPALMPIATNLFTNNYWRINWGDDGAGDNIFFLPASSSSINWKHQYTTYTHVDYILHNFHRLNQ